MPIGRKGIENVFLIYANNSLKEDPLHLWELTAEIPCRIDGRVLEGAELYDDITRGIILFNKEAEPNEFDNEHSDVERFLSLVREIPYHDRERIKEVFLRQCLKEWQEPLKNFLFNYYLTVYDNVSQSIHGIGEDCGRILFGTSDLCGWRREQFSSESFEGSKRLKCYECDQLHFIQILSQISEGREYDTIPFFNLFLSIQNETTILRREYFCVESQRNRPEAFEVALEENEIVEFPIRTDMGESNPDNFVVGFSQGMAPFRRVLLSAATYSLASFLGHNDRRKLKKCQQCGDFFIARTIRANQKYCSERCKRASRWTPEKWAEYMRGYRARRRQEAERIYEEQTRKSQENEIQRNIELLGLTREEAIKLMEADRRK